MRTRCEIDDFTDEELHAHYCFQQESILLITNLVAGLVISVATLEEIMPYCHVTLFVSLFWMTERFSSTFFIKMAVSDVVKFGFWTA